MTTLTSSPKRQLKYEAWGAADELMDCTAPEVLLDGPAGTGKSRGVGEYILQFLQNHKGCRVAAIRKTRVSMTQSWLVTWETKVLGDRLDERYLYESLASGPGRANRDHYRFKNG